MDERLKAFFAEFVNLCAVCDVTVDDDDGLGWAALLREANAIIAELSARQEPVAWLVLDRNGYVMHAASWEQAAHDHINDAINEHDLKEAADWIVRPCYTTPPLPEAPDTVRVPREPTQDMLYAMAELDGWKRGDREHPMLTRWEDYWVAALDAAPKDTTP